MPQIGRDFARGLATKVLVFDISNPVPSRDGKIATWAREKAGLASAELLPGARLVRAFNAIGGYAKLPEAARRPS